jgi:hypothetical protein
MFTVPQQACCVLAAAAAMLTCVPATPAESTYAQKTGIQLSPVQNLTPSPPTGLTATGGNGIVALHWTASVGAIGYRVRRATRSGGPYGTIASVTTTYLATMKWNDTNVTNGTTYFYVVAGFNTIGEGANSAEASATPRAN